MKIKSDLAIFFIFILLALTGDAFAESIETESEIIEVTVYPNSALLTRLTPLKLNTGDYEIIFSNIIPEVDEHSLKVSAQGSAKFKLLGAQVKKEYLEESPSQRIKQLNEQIQKLEDEKKDLANKQEIYLNELEFIKSINLFSANQIPKEVVTKMPQVSDLESLLKFIDVKSNEISQKIHEAEVKTRDLKIKIDALRKELSQLLGPVRKLQRSIVVGIQIQKQGNLDLSVSYMVRGASWKPLYDARASFEKNQVELICYGIVRQTTGEDWEDVEISLSTAKPAIGGRMPYIAPWFLKPYQPQVLKKEKKIAFLGAVGAGAPLSQYEAFDKLAEEEAPVEVVEYAKAEEKGVAVVYKLPHKAMVKSDGSEHKLSISSQDLAAKFEYSTYPRATLFAYLGSRVTNAQGLQLLAGRVNIFLEGDFVGTSSIDNIGPGEEFDLYLGVDENVKIKRECLEKKADETLIAGIPSPTRRVTSKYKLTAENYKAKRINLKLFEAIPVSQDERIKVKINNVSLEPNQKDWKDRKGVWLWELELKPKKKQEIFYILIIEHPRDMQVEGLQY